MAFSSISPTAADKLIADSIAAHTNPTAERLTAALTWGADEKVICAVALGWWLYCRGRNRDERQSSDHILLTAVVTAGVPHVLKRVFNQRRPDRTTVVGHWRGIPFSGKSRDAFPSGHAVHIGGLASAATLLRDRPRNAIWLIGATLATTRIVLLAHWASDVVAGLALGALTERVLRLGDRTQPDRSV